MWYKFAPVVGGCKRTDMTERGLRVPLLYCSDDCPGLRKALKAVWPKSLPQKCQAHKMRNILSKLPRGVQGEMKKQIHKAFHAKSYEEGLRRGRGLIEQYEDRYPRAMECLSKSLEEDPGNGDLVKEHEAAVEAREKARAALDGALKAYEAALE